MGRWVDPPLVPLGVSICRNFPVILALTLAGGTARAQCVYDEFELIPDDVAVGDTFSWADVDGDMVVLGLSRSDTTLVDTGAVYIYRLDAGGASQEGKLVPADVSTGDLFGRVVKAHGDVVVAVAPHHDALGTDSGAAYVFRFDGVTWVEEQKLTASDGAAFDRFGASLGLSGDVIAVGTWEAATGGAVYVFRYDGSTWVQEQKIADPGMPGNRFAYSLDVSADVLAVAAYLDDDKGFDAGAAYIFGYEGASWVQKQKVVASDGASGDLFGKGLAVDGDLLICGGNRADAPAFDSGAAWLFRNDGSQWVEEQKLVPSNGGATERFGTASDIRGNVVSVSARLKDTGGLIDAGAGYIFAFDGSAWIETDFLEATDPVDLDQFGHGLATDGKTAVGLSVFHQHAGVPTGAAYVFRLQGPCQPLSAAPQTISVAAGGTQTFTLDAGAGHAGALYILLGTLSGTSPGLSLGSFTFPLNLDGYFNFSLAHPNEGPLVNTFASMDPEGGSTASLVLGPGVALTLVGRTAHHAFGVIDPLAVSVGFVSNPVELDFVP